MRKEDGAQIVRPKKNIQYTILHVNVPSVASADWHGYLTVTLSLSPSRMWPAWNLQ